MSIVKFANGRNCGTEALKNGINYILNPCKTSRNLIYGNGVSLDSPYEDMNTVQSLLRKTAGRKYIHYIISFDPGITADIAYTVSIKCSEYFANEYQYVLAIHTNTPNIHAHVILNAVNIRTGKKFSQSTSELLKFRDYVNKHLIQNGLNPISSKVSNKLVCEEVIENDSFELDHDVLLVDLNHTHNVHCSFSEVNQLHAYGLNSSYFGPVDYEEALQIYTAEVYHSHLQEVINFFQGTSSTLPSGINIVDAEALYEHWCDGQQCLEEEEDYGFFAKNARHANR